MEINEELIKEQDTIHFKFLLKFLHNEGCHGRFVKNWKDNLDYNIDKMEKLPQFFATAFIWKNTEEGFHFWKEKSHKWNKIEKLILSNSFKKH